MFTIAQITDLHVTTDKDPLNRRRNESRLRQVLSAIHAMRPRPAAIVVSGDVVDRGEADEYAAMTAIFADVQIPVFYGVGNHDRRAPFLAAVGGRGAETDENGFVQYAVDLGPLRLIVCDTLDEGYDNGEFCELRAAWLAARLDEAPDQLTIVALHHPPIPSGIQWMDPSPDDPWIARLAGAVRGRSQVRGILCGHVHRSFQGMLAGQLVSAAPATSIQLTLDLTPVDPRHPDGREILVEEPPGFGLVMVENGQVTIHACVAGDFVSAVNYTVPFVKA